MSCPIFNEQVQNVKLKTSLQQAYRKMTDLVLMGFFPYCNTVFEAISCFYHFCPCQEVRSFLTEVVIHFGSDVLTRHFIQEKGFNVVEMGGGAIGEDCTKQSILVDNISENTFLTGVHLQLSN